MASESQILKRLAEQGINAVILTGPRIVGQDHEISMGAMPAALKGRLWMGGRGKTLVDLGPVIGGLQGVQLGTNRHRDLLRSVVSQTNKLAGQYKLGNYALYCGGISRAEDLPRWAKLVRTVRDVGGRPALYAATPALRKVDQASRAALFQPLDTLIVSGEAGVLALADEFKKDAPNKTLALRVWHPDAYALGFYCWGIGADGAYLEWIFPNEPLFNAFWFDGRALLTPTARWDFEPTLGLLRAAQGISDYYLAQRCEALAASARQR
ncbi:hypothetical protein LCGC14_2991290, partial [marine sediment metagenome]